MEFVDLGAGQADAISALYREAFTASEGPEEGALIGALAHRLLTGTPARDIHAFAARVEGELVGAIVFSRMSYAGDARLVFVLAPVAVATDRQGQGVGSALIGHGLDALRARGVDVALTYGDPAYYGRMGFRPITTEIAAAPYPLQFPHGWLGQALDGGPLRPLVGEVACVPALADPAFW
jgi:putative acetyltransferase